MHRFLTLIPILFLLSCATTKPPKQEFRGVWVATVANIDWPKHPEDEVATNATDPAQSILNVFDKALEFLIRNGWQIT